MKTNPTFTKPTRAKALLLLAFLALLAASAVKAESLILYSSSSGSNQYVPMSVYNSSSNMYSCAQFVVPGDILTDMTDGYITMLRFNTTTNIAWTTMQDVTVYLTGMDQTSISAFVDQDSATVVFHGTAVFKQASPRSSTIDINFTTAYHYTGGNLLIGVETRTNVGSSTIKFYGATVGGASVSGVGPIGSTLTPTQRNFIPRTVIFYTMMAPPSDLTATPDPDNGTVASLSWTENGTATQWELQYATDSTFAESATTSLMVTDTPSAALSGLSLETTYYARVRSVGDNDPSPWSNSISFTTSNLPPPPANIAASNQTENSATLSWTAPEIDLTITGYTYQYKRFSDANWSAEVTTNNTSVTITGMTNGTYMFRVKTICNNFESSYATVYFCTAEPIPYECSFEDNELYYWSDASFWTLVNDGSSHITTYEHHSGDYSFKFYCNDGPQYLISPPFNCTEALKVSFYHLNNMPPIPTFQLGYSTTTSDPADFIWVDEITASYEVWELYESVSLPAETRYVAIKYDYNGSVSDYWLYLDDFTFEYTAKTRPSNLTVSGLTEHNATLSWTAPNASVTGYAFQCKPATDSDWPEETIIQATNVTFQDLTTNTEYDFRVKALYANGYASLYASTSFITEGEMETLPHFQGFEDGMGGWRIVNGCGSRIFNIDQNDEGYLYVYNGSYSFFFYEHPEAGGDPYYLISPQFEGSSMTVSFYYKNLRRYINGIPYSFKADFQVGYSTTTKDLNAFTWGDTITSSTQWQQYVNDFPDGTKYIAIKKIKWWQLFVDNISIQGPCPTPTDLGISVDGTNVTMSWSSNADAYQLCLNDDYFDIGVPHFTLNLEPYTTYTMKVRSHCYYNFTTEWSEWSDPYTFTFEPTCPTPYNLHVSVNGTDATVSWSGDAGAWQICFNDDGNYIDVDEPIYTYNGLEPNTTYTLKVRSHCLGSYYVDEWSGWTNPVSFSLPPCPSPYYIYVSVSPNGTEATAYWNSNADGWQICFNNGNYIDVNEPTYTFTGLQPYTTYTIKVRSHCLGNCNFGEWSEWYTTTITPRRTLTLANDADNRDAISEANGEMWDVVLADRTLYRDGSWNTLCLPFNLNDFSGTPLEGATVKTLASSAYNNNMLTMNFAGDFTSIEAGKPYLVKWDPGADADLVIRSTDDWNAFAASVNSGTSYKRKLVKLAADISVTTMVGSYPSHPFEGTFDGCGHTLTVNYTSTEEYCAPFRVVDSAFFCNLKVAGTISTSNKHAGGFIGLAWNFGRMDLWNCRSSVTISSSVVGDGSHGGFIGLASGPEDAHIYNCLFDGCITGSQTEKCGGFVGWVEHRLDIYNSLMAGTMDIILNANSATFCRQDYPSNIYSNCYYKGTFGAAELQGTYTNATGTELQALLGGGWEVRDGEVVPKMQRTLGNIANPAFSAVTINNASANVTSTAAEFIGSYAPFINYGLLFDAHNPDGNGQHAAIGITETVTPPGYYPAGWYTDAELTTPATSIPFDENGSVTLYVGWEPFLALANNADNSSVISEAEGQLHNVVFADRTLYKDGSWNTLCLPFNLDNFNGTPLEGAMVKTLASSTYSDDVLTMNFTDDLTAIEAGKPYIVKWDADPNLVIQSAADWNAFAADVNNGTSYRGKTVRLAADISVSTMVGTNEHPFSGIFDGDGHTLTLNLNGSQEYRAPFRFVDGATICNLTIAGNITNTAKFAAGLVGYMKGTSSIARCIINATIDGRVSGDGSHGGFIAYLHYGETTITDCVFNGKLRGYSQYCGGFVGWTETNTATLTITNCLFAPTEITLSEYGSCTFSRARNTNLLTITNSYYTQSFGEAQGTYTNATGAALQTLLGDGWEVIDGEVVPKTMIVQNPYETIVNPKFFNVTISSATANVTTTYADFIGSYAPFSGDGLLLDAHNPNGDALHAALDIIDPANAGDNFAGWSPNAELTTLVTDIPFAEDGTVTLYAIIWPGDGTEENPYIITTIGQLEALAHSVNNGNSYEGKFFCLGADLNYDANTPNNHTPIGNSGTHHFCGTFDGYYNGTYHTISGIRISNVSNYQGLFGTCYSSTVKNLTLTDAQITGSTKAAGIVSDNWDGTIENCHVTNTVVINGNKYVGGIAGWNDGGTVSGCSSMATVNGSGSCVGGLLGANKGGSLQNLILVGAQVTSNTKVGGIVGDNWNESTVEDCHVVDATISGNSLVGGIVGWKDGGMVKYCTVTDVTVSAGGGAIIGTNNNGPFQYNYYMGCTVGEATANIGTGNGDVTADDGAVRGYYLTLAEHVTSDALTFTIPAYGTTPETTYHVAGNGTTITLGYELPGRVVTYYVNGVAIAGDTFTMPAEDVSVTITWTPDPAHFEQTDTDEYTIYTATGWDLFCDALQDNATYNRFIGKTVKLDADISVVRMAGGSGHEFMGTFDGQGHTLTVDYTTTAQFTAPFSYINGATIMNLTTGGTINTSAKFAGGMVGATLGVGTIEITNCVSDVTINSSVTGDGTHGGFLAVASYGAVNFSGCMFSGEMLTESTTLWGGFVGWTESNHNATVTFTDCFFNPTNLATNNGRTFTRARNMSSVTITNSYYTMPLGTAQGYPAVSDPAITPVGEPTGTYNVSGLTAYVNGLMYGETFYYHPQRNFLLTIDGYSTGSGGWNLLASPVADTLSPTLANGFLTNTYDLYRFNPTHEDNEWENYKADSFTLENGRGYLYANSGDVTLVFGGIPYDGDGEVALVYDANDIQKCWNLVGNPFTCNAYLDREYYVLRSDGLGINPVAIPATTPVPPFTAVFVKAVVDGDAAVFTKVTQ